MDSPSDQGERRDFVAKQTLYAVASLALSLLLMELIARLVISVGSPPHYYSADFDKKYALAQSLSLQTAHGILVLGTSRAQKGIYPELVSSELTRLHFPSEVINLAAYGSLPKDDAFLGETAFEKGYRPSLVLYDVGPEDFLYRAGRSGFSDEFLHSPGGSAAMQSKSDIGATLKQMMDRNCMLFAYRQYFKSVVLTLPNRILHPLEAVATGPGQAAGDGSPLGWSPGYGLLSAGECEKQITAYSQSNQPIPKADALPVESLKSYLSPIVTLCQSRKIPLVFVWLPRLSHAVKLCDEKLAKYSLNSTSLLTKTCLACGTSLIDLGADDDANHFSDITHLSATGSIKASCALAAHLAQRPSTFKIESKN
jgi:hypothetical protein